MNFKIFLILLSAFAIGSCSNLNNKGLSGEAGIEDKPKFQYTSYTDDFELFAEADPFIIGETANILSHFSILPGFRALESGKIIVVLTVNGKETVQTLDSPTRKGIYSFDIKPETSGKGSLRFEVEGEKEKSVLIIPDITVFTTIDEAHEAAESIVISKTNATAFTKEQSWKIDFATGLPERGPFGQVIKSTAFIQSAPGDEVVITAKTDGIVTFTSGNLLAGRNIKNSQVLFTISGSELAENNSSVRYAEARNNFEKAKADHDRAMELSKDKIVSEKELLAIRLQFENSKAVYDNLSKNFNSSGQIATSPLDGFIKQVFVKNGSYVEAGQTVLTVYQNKTLILTSDVPQKYLPILGSLKSADIRSLTDDQVYTLEQLNGKVISYGKSANADNFLIPVNLQIENSGKFISGSFVEVWLKTVTDLNALTVPNTSLIEEQGNYFVYMQITPELFEKREVIPGVSDAFRSEILKGITENDRIVTRGPMLIKLAQATGTLDAHSGHVH